MARRDAPPWAGLLRAATTIALLGWLGCSTELRPTDPTPPPGSDQDGDGFGPNAGDCDDEDPTVHPGATDVCDYKDNDCDGAVDEQATMEVTPLPAGTYGPEAAHTIVRGGFLQFREVLRLGDVTGDGRDDFISGTADIGDALWSTPFCRGEYRASEAAASHVDGGMFGGARFAALGDVNGDGYGDFRAGTGIWFGPITDAFDFTPDVAVPFQFADLVAGRFDADDIVDLVVGFSRGDDTWRGALALFRGPIGSAEDLVDPEIVWGGAPEEGLGGYLGSVPRGDGRDALVAVGAGSEGEFPAYAFDVWPGTGAAISPYGVRATALEQTQIESVATAADGTVCLTAAPAGVREQPGAICGTLGALRADRGTIFPGDLSEDVRLGSWYFGYLSSAGSGLYAMAGGPGDQISTVRVSSLDGAVGWDIRLPPEVPGWSSGSDVALSDDSDADVVWLLVGRGDAEGNSSLHVFALERPLATGDDDDAGDDDDDSASSTIAPLQFVTVPAGTFDMGCTWPTACPSPDVATFTLTRDLLLMATPVTQQQWEVRMDNNPAFFSQERSGVDCGPDCPVESVNFWEAAAFANAVSLEEGLSACYELVNCVGTAGAGLTCEEVANVTVSGSVYDCEGYRLPTEAEWEHAARAGTNFHYAGSDEAPEVAWYAPNSSGSTQPVGQKLPNGWGLHDLSGNVREWTNSRYVAISALPQVDPDDLEFAQVRRRTTRGGGWYVGGGFIEVYRQYGRQPEDRSIALGFRLARTVQ